MQMFLINDAIPVWIRVERLVAYNLMQLIYVDKYAFEINC